MNSIEERLVRDIAVVTRGVVVSEQELLDARSAIDERAEAAGRRGRHRTIALVAAAAVVIAGVGFGAVQVLSQDAVEVTPAGQGDPTDDVYADFLTGDAPTPENLNGFWKVDNANTLVRFQPDGTVQFSDQGALISNPVTTGTFTIDGDAIDVTTADAPRCIGTEFAMRAALPEPGRLNVVLAEPQFGTCEAVATTIALERVLPADYFADLTAPGRSGWKPVTDDSLLHGDWLAEGGGHLLEIAADGTYYVAGDSGEVVDNGLWRVRRSALELFSRTESPQCEEGDFLVLGQVEYALDQTRWLRGTVDQNDCRGAWTPDAWLLLPDASED